MSNFALLGRVDWLRDLWPGRLVTSDEAWKELQTGTAIGRIPALDWSWLEVLSLTPEEISVYDELMPPLGEGEAACLALARSRSYGLLTDDRVARREAQRLGIPLSGTLGALKSPVDEGRLSLQEADEALQSLIDFGYRSPFTSVGRLY